MEEQFNRKHGTVSRKFKIGAKVFVQQWKAPHFVWTKGVVKGRVGAVNYEVEVNGKVIRKHANQMRPRLDGDDSLKDDSALKTLLDVLELQDDQRRGVPLSQPVNNDATNATDRQRHSSPQTPPPLRRSTRIRRPVQRYGSPTA